MKKKFDFTAEMRVRQLNCVKPLLRYALTSVGGRDF